MGGELPPDAELEVLGELARAGELTATELRQKLKSSRPLTHSAICTLLTRLMERGLIARRKGPVGKAFIYRAVNKGKRTQGLALRELARRLFDGDPSAVVASLFERTAPTIEQLDELKKLLDELRSKKPKGASRE